MKKFRIMFMVFGAVTLMSGCRTASDTPVIRFIGVATGSLLSPVDALSFTSRFKATEHNLVGIVGFSEVHDGTKVQATWFSPDDRRMPLGRTQIVTKSGATVARFSLSSKKNWDPAPFMLHILASRGEGEDQLTASGSIRFFIGMNDREVQKYLDEYAEWEKRDQEKRRMIAMAEEDDRALQARAQKILESPVAVLALRRDLNGNGAKDILFLDTRDQPEYVPGLGKGSLLNASVRQLVAMTASGETIFGVRQTKKGYSFINTRGTHQTFARASTESVQATLLASGTLSLSWMEDEKTCSLEARYERSAGEWRADAPVCE